LPTVSKLLKQLAHAQLVTSSRGVNGGYRLARAPQQITIADIVTAMEGPIGMTECGAHAGLCDHEPHCGVRVNWQRINQAIAQALANVTVADMVKPAPKRRATIPCSWRRPEHRHAIMTSELARPATKSPRPVRSPTRSAAATAPDSSPISKASRRRASTDVVRAISARKNEPEWMTQWRLAAYRHWLTMTPPH
jgi:FeS assembly SUF system regulator